MALKKKADISMNMIVIAAIAILAMLVMMMIFSGRVGQANKDFKGTQDQFALNKCANPQLGRTCEPSGCNSDTQSHIAIMDYACNEGNSNPISWTSQCCEKK